MRAVVPVKDIVSNPYQARKKISTATVRALADEIKEVGLWPGSLRGRMKDGKVQLVYGHRRLQALKVLGYKEVEIEIDDLSDEEMAYQSLAENFQREDLTDLEKAEGIQMVLNRLKQQGVAEAEAMQKTCKIVGLSPGWVKDLLSMIDMEGEVKRAIRDRQIAGRTALEAHRFGGKEMVKTAIKEKLPVHKISDLAQKIRRIPDPTVREQLKRDVVKGKIIDPAALDVKARKLVKGRPVKAPVNLDVILGTWERTLGEWSDRVEELLVYRKFLSDGPKGANLRREAAALAKKLSKLVE